jgi:chromosome segregation ATPase
VSEAAATEIHTEDRRLQAEIDALRGTCRDTQELYFEVCVLLFFRHGITPTANKLYQLVRKGSMSAPAEALSRFWATLRDKSRVRIEHPDLPEELRDAAGEAISALWQRAQALAGDSLAALRGEAKATVATARAEVEATLARAQSADESLERVRQELGTSHAARQQLEQDLAREQGLRSALERQLGDAALQRQELQRALDELRQSFERQMGEQRAATGNADERHQADLRRVLLDLDRERSAATKSQKDVDQARRLAAEQADQHRAQVGQLQQELGQLRQKVSAAEAALAEARGAGDALRAQLEKRLDVKPARKAVARKRL